MEPFLGEIRIFSFGFMPRGWQLCNGQILAVATNQALFALLGTQYGGNGQTTFALPNLQGRMAMGFGTSPITQAYYSIGRAAGAESVTLLPTQIPAHSHQVTAAHSATSTDPAGSFLAGPAKPAFTTGTAGESMAPEAVGATGGSQPHTNMHPFTVLNFCMATSGWFPSRD